MTPIYDEALKDLSQLISVTCDGQRLLSKTKKALEQAKKEHELLELFRKRKLFVPCYPGINWNKLYELDNQIKTIEEELK